MRGVEVLLHDLEKELLQIQDATYRALAYAADVSYDWDSYRKTIAILNARREVIQARLERLLIMFAQNAKQLPEA